MEKFSENKRKRGRPRVLLEEKEKGMEQAGLFHRKHSRRTKVNRYYESLAMIAIMALHPQKYKQRYEWLIDSENKKQFRGTIMAELGRFYDFNLICSAADRICDLKPKTKDAVIMIRQWRLGDKRNKPEQSQLGNEIINTINDYLLRHPETTRQQIYAALMSVLDGAIKDDKKHSEAVQSPDNGKKK